MIFKKNLANGNPKFQLKRPASEDVIDMAKIGGRDPNLDLFHAMGKVLYCKREESLESHKLPGI